MKRKNHFANVLRALAIPLAAAAAVLCLVTAVSNLQSGRNQQGKQQLEDTIRRAAVTCYATEGIYPPTLKYLEQHYGVQVDVKRYTVDYHVFAENLVPDITVLENEG
jgi:hypothetical protein